MRGVVGSTVTALLLLPPCLGFMPPPPIVRSVPRAPITKTSSAYTSNLSNVGHLVPPKTGIGGSKPLAKIRKVLPSAARAAIQGAIAISPMIIALAAQAASGGRLGGGSNFRSGSGSGSGYSSGLSSPGYYSSPSRSLGSSHSMQSLSPLHPFGGLGLGLGLGAFPFSPALLSRITIIPRLVFTPLDAIIIGGMAYSIIQAMRTVKDGQDGSTLTEGGMVEDTGAMVGGISLLKLQVSVYVPERSTLRSVLKQLDRLSYTSDTSTSKGLAKVVADTSLTLLRNEVDWAGAHGEAKWFRRGSEAEAEATYQRMAVEERAKFDYETDMTDKAQVRQAARSNRGAEDRPTLAVVTLCVALRGKAPDVRKLKSPARLREVLQELAAGAQMGEGERVVATEVLWTPQEAEEVLTKADVINDYPQLIDF